MNARHPAGPNVTSRRDYSFWLVGLREQVISERGHLASFQDVLGTGLCSQTAECVLWP